MTNWPQDHVEKERYYQNAPANDTISSATATITPTGPTLGTVAVAAGGASATLAVSGLTAGTRYVLRLLYTCGSGDILQAECSITGE